MPAAGAAANFPCKLQMCVTPLAVTCCTATVTASRRGVPSPPPNPSIAAQLPTLPAGAVAKRKLPAPWQPCKALGLHPKRCITPPLPPCSMAKRKVSAPQQVRKALGFNPKDKKLVLTTEDVAEALQAVRGPGMGTAGRH